MVGKGEVVTKYLFDDGESFSYRKGKRSEAVITAKLSNNRLSVEIAYLSEGCGKGDFTFTTEASVKAVLINGKSARPCAPQGVSVSKAPLVTWKPE